MKIRITKLAGGGRYANGFFVIGNGQAPQKTFNLMMSVVDDSSPDTMSFAPRVEFFVSETIKYVWETSYGYLLVMGQALWTWEEMVKEKDGKWIRD